MRGVKSWVVANRASWSCLLRSVRRMRDTCSCRRSFMRRCNVIIGNRVASTTPTSSRAAGGHSEGPCQIWAVRSQCST